MHLCLIFLGVFLTATRSYGSQQLQMPEAGAFMLDEDLVEQIERLRHNVTELWTNFRELKSALTDTLNHLRVHQAELEETVHMLEHKHEDGGSFHGSYTDDHHHHSGEQHGDSHSHGDDHHHSDEQHSHGDNSHSHSGEQHSHGDDHSHGDNSHSHSGEQHGHGEDHYHRSYSHSYSSASHHHDDSHEKSSDDFQQTQKEDSPMIEPLVVASNVQQHYHQQQKPLSAISDNYLRLINDSAFNSHHHHHQHRPRGRTARNRTVVIPKFSENGLYDFAVCNVQPNRAIPEDQQQDITGRINLWQRKSGGPLNIHIRLQGFDVGGHHGHHGDQQAVQQEQEDNQTPMGHRHGFHIHSLGDLSNGCQSTGPHFNPKNVNHGAPSALIRHVGDLGNIECDDHGNANILFNDDIASLKGPYSVIGKSMVIHAGQDDFGLGGNDESLRTGNAGTRIACCVIEKADKLPFRAYKFLKTATQYNNAQ